MCTCNCDCVHVHVITNNYYEALNLADAGVYSYRSIKD